MVGKAVQSSSQLKSAYDTYEKGKKIYDQGKQAQKVYKSVKKGKWEDAIKGSVGLASTVTGMSKSEMADKALQSSSQLKGAYDTYQKGKKIYDQGKEIKQTVKDIKSIAKEPLSGSSWEKIGGAMSKGTQVLDKVDSIKTGSKSFDSDKSKLISSTTKTISKAQKAYQQAEGIHQASKTIKETAKGKLPKGSWEKVGAVGQKIDTIYSTVSGLETDALIGKKTTEKLHQSDAVKSIQKAHDKFSKVQQTYQQADDLKQKTKEIKQIIRTPTKGHGLSKVQQLSSKTSAVLDIAQGTQTDRLIGKKTSDKIQKGIHQTSTKVHQLDKTIGKIQSTKSILKNYHHHHHYIPYEF